MKTVWLHVEQEPTIQLTLTFADDYGDPQLGDRVAVNSNKHPGTMDELEITSRMWRHNPGGEVELHITAK